MAGNVQLAGWMGPATYDAAVKQNEATASIGTELNSFKQKGAVSRRRKLIET